MSLFNKWLSPLDRSFGAIKQKLLAALDNIKDPNNPNKPLITDKSEGNIFTILISMFSAIAEVLHFYIDNTARESFLVTARQYDSLLKHGALVDYHSKGATASSVDVTLTRSNNLGKLNLFAGTTLTDNLGNTWTLLKSNVFPNNASIKVVTLYQVSLVTNTSHTTEEIIDGRFLTISSANNSTDFYAQGTMQLTIGDVEYTLVETFSKSKPTDNHFMVDILENGSLFITFGDGVNGSKVDTSNSRNITLVYYNTKGEAGNIDAGSIDTTWPEADNITVRNGVASGGGSDYEDFEMLRRRIPLSIKTLDVAISKEDFKDLAMTRPEVGQAAVEYECGRKLNVYIATIDGKSPSRDICDNVKNYLIQHCPMTTWLDVKPVGITHICLNIEVTGHKSYKEAYIRNQIETALTNRYSAANSQIGGSVRLSDIYALIDNLSSVDYLRVNEFYLKPWPKILRGIQLELGTYSLTKCDRNMEYLLEYQGHYIFNVYAKYNGYKEVITSSKQSDEDGGGAILMVNDTCNGVNFSLVIKNIELLQPGYKYSIYITQNSLDYEEPGYNIPIFDIGGDDLVLTVNEVL